MRLRNLLGLLLALPLHAQAPVYGYKVVATFPHSTASYTEGFFFRDGHFYEGTGLAGHSAILELDPASGRVLQQHIVPAQYFGEGIVDWGPNLLEWTWQTHTGFVLDRATFRVLSQFTYTGEGWGMTHDDRELITSDGTATLRFRNPQTFAETRNITVHEDTPHGVRPIDQLNELEYLHGQIYANVWHSNRIARIDPRTGKVLSWIDCSGLLSPLFNLGSEAVLNGIAYDQSKDRLFVTGKQWPTIFEIRPTSPAKR